MSECGAAQSCVTIGAITLILIMATLAGAEIPLSPGASCASATCHKDILESDAAHDSGRDPQSCGRCHVAQDPRRHEFRFAASPGDLCTGCHSQLIQHQFNHAPASTGLCTFCHSAHVSQYPRHLKIAPAALCVTCHNKIVQDGARTVHGPVEQGLCTACHDPHGSKFDDHLHDSVPELCFRCHNRDQVDHGGTPLPAVEGTFVDKSLRQHPPFARGDCLLCHVPHASNFIRLQRWTYSQAFYTDFSSDSYFCLMCHGETTFAEPRTLSATRFRNGNLNLHYRHVVRDKGRGCRACHHQHASSLEAQIAKDAVLGKQDIGIKEFSKTETGGTCAPLCHRPVRYDRANPVENSFMVTPREGVDATAAELRQASIEHDGKALYLQRCAGCHGADAEGKIGPPIRGATIERVKAATARVGLMADLATLDPADLNAIVESLPAGTPVVALPEGASDGTILFSTNCAGCHGADANGRVGPAIRGATSASITDAIGRVPMMVAMKSLSAGSIDAIGDYLSGLGKGATATGDAAAATAPDGQVVYSMNCIGCHGADANGQIGPSIRGKSAATIGDAIGRVPMMAGLKTLGSAEITAVSRYLAGFGAEEASAAAIEPVDGKAFFTGSCSACHGEDASGHVGPDIRGRSVNDIRAAIARVPMMAGVRSASAAQINAVGEYIHDLAVAAPVPAPQAPADGAAIFKENCAVCHGPDATGLIGPNITFASRDDIAKAIDRVPMMIAMKVLGARDIQAAAEYLADLRKSSLPRADQ